MDNQPILKKTLVTMAVMVGAWVAFVGTLSIVAVVVTSHIVGTSHDANEVNETVEPARLPGVTPASPHPNRSTREHGDKPQSPTSTTPQHHRETI